MNGPRGSLVIALLFLIGGQLCFITAALTQQPSVALLGGALMICFVLVIVRVIVELFRQGAAAADAEAVERRAARRVERARREDVPAPVTPTAMLDPEGGVTRLDPQKRRPDHA